MTAHICKAIFGGKGKALLAHSTLCSAEIDHKGTAGDMSCILADIPYHGLRCGCKQNKVAFAKIVGRQFGIDNALELREAHYLPVDVIGVYNVSGSLESLGCRTSY